MTTSTEFESHPRTDPRHTLERALTTGEAAISAVDPSQLGDSTPCTEMDVRTLLAHLIGVVERVTALAEGTDPFAVVETPVADHVWPDAWRAAARRAVTAWDDDETLERPMALPWIQGSGAEVLASYLSELTVHTWDLAVATGQQPDWDDEVVLAALESRPVLPADDRRALFEEISASIGLEEVAIPFGDAVVVPDDASPIDRLVAWNGRDPAQWS